MTRKEQIFTSLHAFAELT